MPVRTTHEDEGSKDPKAKAKENQLKTMRKEVQKEAMEMGLTLGYLRNLPDDYLEDKPDGEEPPRHGRGHGSFSMTTDSAAAAAAAAAADDDDDDPNALEPSWWGGGRRLNSVDPRELERRSGFKQLNTLIKIWFQMLAFRMVSKRV